MPDFDFELGGPEIFAADAWEGYELAIRAWVQASGLFDDAKIIRAEQDGPRPTVPFAEVRVGDEVALGACDALETTFDDAAPAGEEVTLTARGQRDLTVTVRVFTNRATGADSARALASKLQVSLRLPSVKGILREGGLTCWDQGSVSQIPAILDTKWEGRASLSIRCYAEETASEKVGYVETVRLTNAIIVPESTFDVTGE